MELELTEASNKQPWVLTIEPTRLLFKGPDGEVRILDRQRHRRNLKPDLLELGLITVYLERKVTFGRNVAAGKALLDWLGPPTQGDLDAALLQRHNTPSLVVSLLLIVVSLPWVAPGWLQTGLGGDEGFDYLLLGWGVGSVLMWFGARAVRKRVWFIVDGVFNTAITAWWLAGVFQGTRSTWWLLMAPLALLGWMAAVRNYRRFARLVSPDLRAGDSHP